VPGWKAVSACSPALAHTGTAGGVGRCPVSAVSGGGRATLAKARGWVINLAVAEWVIRRKRPRRRKRAARRGSNRDHDLSADLALLEQPHGLGRLVERIAAIHARDDLAVLDEAGESLEVGGALLRHQQHQTLPQEG
jgi:hypothetical protein